MALFNIESIMNDYYFVCVWIGPVNKNGQLNNNGL